MPSNYWPNNFQKNLSLFFRQHFQERYDPESVLPKMIILKFVEIVDGATLKNEKTHNIFQRVGHFKWTISRTNFRFIGQVTAKKILF